MLAQPLGYSNNAMGEGRGREDCKIALHEVDD
jgi:hypothetical protein